MAASRQLGPGAASRGVRLILWRRLGRPEKEWTPWLRSSRDAELRRRLGQVEAKSDAYATGQALYALAEAGANDRRRGRAKGAGISCVVAARKRSVADGFASDHAERQAADESGPDHARRKRLGRHGVDPIGWCGQERGRFVQVNLDLKHSRGGAAKAGHQWAEPSNEQNCEPQAVVAD